MKISLTQEFTYWHGGHTAEVYGPGLVDVPDDVAQAAEACGVTESVPEGTRENSTRRKEK